MTILDFQEELAIEIGKVLKDVATMNCFGENVYGVTVYKQQLPVIVSDEEDVCSLFPYAIVEVFYGSTENEESPWIVDTEIQVAVHDSNEANQGHQHIAVMCQRIINRFCADPMLAQKYRAMPDIEWAFPGGEDNDTYPYFFGFVRIPFSIPKIGRRTTVYD